MAETTTLPSQPVARDATADLKPAADQLTAQLRKNPEIKGFKDLDLTDLSDKTPRQNEGADIQEEIKKTIDQARKSTASEILRKNEGKTAKVEPDGQGESDALHELDSLQDTTPPKEEKKGKSQEENIRELRTSRETALAEAKTARETLAAKEAEWNARFEELNTTLEKTAFEKSPAFQRKFADPAKAARDELTAFAKEVIGDESLVPKALALAGKEQIAFIDENTGGGAAAGRFLNLINQVESRQRDLQAAIDNHKETAATFTALEKADEGAKDEAARSNLKALLDRAGSKLSWFKLTGDAEKDADAHARRSAVESIVMGTASQEDMMLVPVHAVIAKDALRENAELRRELAKYKARVREDTDLEPRINGGEREARTDANKDKNGKPKGALASVKEQYRW